LWLRYEEALRWSDVSIFRLVRLEDGIHDREQRISESVISRPKEGRVHANDGSFQRNCKPSAR
jgi:hypothetical protein